MIKINVLCVALLALLAGCHANQFLKEGWTYQTNFIDGDDNENLVSLPNGNGAVEGVVYPGARAFYSIPYAAPPNGTRRFMPPSPALGWQSTLMAKQFGPACPQHCDLPPFTCPIRGSNEDCLHLDVYTPRLATIDKPLPVMVFYYGGNYIQGGSSTPLYNGNYLANNTNAVVVVINYRLGALSFFINDNLKGNLGTQDQTYALEWVKQNIAAFGGDAGQVTIFGQSAGGSSVACHLVSPAASGLFHGAIMESNPIQLVLNTKDQMNSISARFADLLGCNQNDVECLQSQNLTAVITAQTNAVKVDIKTPLNAFMPWQPYIDGDVLPIQPMEAFKTGQYNQVPFMLGNVEDEGIIFIYEAFPTPIPPIEYRAILKVIFREVASQVLEMYPPPKNPKGDSRDVLAQLGTDYIWACPQRNLSRYMSEFQPLYYYRFDHVFSFDPWGPDYSVCVNYSCHGAELPFVFNSAPKGGYQWSSDEAVLAQLVSSHWGNFATSGNPNGPVKVAEEWLPFSASGDDVMHYMTPQSTMETGYLKTYCDFWDTIGYEWGVTVPQ